MNFVHAANDRGYAQHGWLTSRHSFSFADYYHPDLMGFSALRVINEDIIAPGAGFGTHPHKDMEILTYVLSGTVAPRDSMGNQAQIHAGEFQIMSAGTGIRHSEYNARDDALLHLYQIWLLPTQTGLSPRYEQRRFAAPEGRQLVLSPDARDGSLRVFQDMTLTRWALSRGRSDALPIAPDRRLWLQVIAGALTVNEKMLAAGDALAVWNESRIALAAHKDSEVLLFDLPPV